jgi:uncharacterized protein with von Willebrand factor type A (vWA) domain
MKTGPLLYPLFEHLRRNNFQLGISEYLLAIKALRYGIGLESPEKLKQVCRLLWAKSEEEQIQFDEAFSVLVESLLEPTAAETGFQEPSELDFDQTRPLDKQKEDPAEKDMKMEAESSVDIEKKKYEVQPTSFTPTVPLESDYIPQEKKYFFTPHLPLECRDMAIIWRQLRRVKTPGKTEELDIDATIKEIGRTGLFLGAKLRTCFQYQIELILLLDIQKSMIPFQLLIDSLERSFSHSNLGNEINKYYFKEFPGKNLYEEPNITNPVPIETLLESNKEKLVLIVSDAGAAKGYYEIERVEKTKNFIYFLEDNNFIYVWLNPMPFIRWEGTTAENISNFVPMFSIDKEGLSNVVRIFQGKYLPSKENLR